MTWLADAAGHWFGLCRKVPVLHSAPAIFMSETGTAISSPPDGSPPPSGRGSIRHGIRIATGSLGALLRERSLLWFVILSSLVMLILPLAGWWRITQTGSVLPFLLSVPVSGKVLVNTFMVFDITILLLEIVCLTGFTTILSGLILHRNNVWKTPVRISDSFTGINGHANSLLALSFALALLATLTFEMISQTRLFGGIAHTISMALFHLPYAYYFPNELSGALYFAFTLMAINTVALLIALPVIPGIVLGNKGLFPALSGAGALMKRSWLEVLGCAVVFGLTLLGVATIALLIGQSPLLLSHDYDFFLQVSRGQVLMTVVCYVFVILCWAVMAAGLTAAGVAVADIYHPGSGTELPKQKVGVGIPASGTNGNP